MTVDKILTTALSGAHPKTSNVWTDASYVADNTLKTHLHWSLRSQALSSESTSIFRMNWSSSLVTKVASEPLTF